MIKVKRLLAGAFTAFYCASLVPVNAININSKTKNNDFAELKINGLSADEYQEYLNTLEKNGDIDLDVVLDMVESGDILYETNVSTINSRAIGGTGNDDRSTIANVGIPDHTIDNKIAYCLDVTKNSPYGLNYSNAGVTTDEGLNAILYHGYPLNSTGMKEKYGLSDTQARKYTQYAVWYYYNPSYFKQRSIPYINELLQHAKNKNSIQNVFNISTNTPSVNEVYKIQESEVITTSGSEGTFTFPSDSNVWSVDLNGNKRNNFAIGESFKVQAVGSVTGTVNKTVTSSIVTPTHQLYLPSNSNYQRLAVPGNSTKILTSSKELSLNFKGIVEQGSIEVKKVDENSKALQGVKFGLYSDKEATKKISTGVTDTNGLVTFSNLDINKTYFVKELEGLNGYVVDSSIKAVELKSTKVSVTVTNSKVYGQIEIIKTEANSDIKLQGAEFGIYDSNSVLVETITTDANGVAKSNKLPYGSYTVKETKAPNGYVLSTESKTVTINENNKSYSISFENAAIKGFIQIHKIDGETKKPLEGVKFGIYRANDNSLVQELSTDKNGIAKSNSLKTGNYYIQETEALEGYILDETKYQIIISEDNKVYEQTIVNSKIAGSFTLTKLDSTTKKPMANVEFKLEALSGTNKGLTWNLKSDENGLVQVDNLVFGNYEITEVETLDGYILNSKPYKFSIKSKGQHVEYTMTNDRVIGSFTLTKLDSATKKPMANVEFKLEALSGINKGTLLNLTTNSDGIVEAKDLLAGNYEVTEVKTLDGYVLNNTPYNFTISENGQKIEYTMENQRALGNLTLVKVDEETNEKLSDVAFRITALSGLYEGKVSNVKTNEEGIVELENLPVGEYEIVEVKTIEGYVLNETPINFTIVENNQHIELTITNKREKGSLNILKYDSETKEPLANVTFSIEALTGIDAGKSWLLQTGETGIIELENLNLGEYQIVEVQANDGYVLNNNPIPFEITENGQVIEKEIANDKITGQFEFLKYDADTKNPISDVEFSVKGLDGFANGIEFIFTTDEKGEYVSERLPYGTYEITEVEAKEGYILDSTPITVSITANDVIIPISKENKMIYGEVDFSKTDATTGHIIEGAYIQIVGVSETNSHINFEFVSEEEGNRFTLPYGKYEITETIAPEGYVLSEEVGTFEILEDGSIVKAELKNERIVGNLQIFKLCQDTNKRLEGATFGIYNSNRELIAEITTDENGVAILENIEYGTYYYKELSSPFGYIIDENEYEFTLENNGDTIVIEFFNKAIPALPDMLEDEDVEVETKEPVQTIIPLPDTSGVNAIVIIVAGAATITGAVLLIKKRKA